MRVANIRLHINVMLRLHYVPGDHGGPVSDRFRPPWTERGGRETTLVVGIGKRNRRQLPWVAGLDF